MAFNVGTTKTSTTKATGHGGYGTGKQGELTVASAGVVVNNYARVTAMAGKTITISGKTSYASAYGSFTAGEEILVHCVGYIGTTLEICKTRGKWLIARINSVNGNVLTLDRSVSDFYAVTSNFNELIVQAVTVPQFKTVTLPEGTSITCTAYSDENKYGGVVVFKCSEDLDFQGGHINLTDKGIPSTASSLYWSYGLVRNEDPTTTYKRVSAGWENYRTTKHLTLNCTDGAALIITKAMDCNSTSRIGRTSQTGEARRRKLGGNGNLGGSSILIAAETITNWTPAIIAKYPVGSAKDYNRGQARCYIATESWLPTDEGLYALDRISTPDRLKNIFNLDGFGKGTTPRNNNFTGQLNSYVKVTSVNATGNVFAIDDNHWDNNGLATFEKGALILIHATTKDKNGFVKENGRCMFSRILKYANSHITLDNNDTFAFLQSKINLSKYFIQIIAIPEFSSWTQKVMNTSTPKFNSNFGGGIAVVAVDGTCNLEDGGIIVEKKGNEGAPYGKTGLDYIGNAQMAERLPLGEGHGSVLILAKTLVMNSNTRIGASYSGRPLGGFNYNTALNAGDTILTQKGSDTKRTITKKGDPWFTDTLNSTWERGAVGRSKSEIQANHVGAGNDVMAYQGRTGGGDGGGYSYSSDLTAERNFYGGYGSNAKNISTKGTAAQGAHVLIIANRIENLCIDAISTGGEGGNYASTTNMQSASAGNGGASYGGAGCTIEKGLYRGGNGGFIGGGGGCGYGADGSGGGSGGFCFVYCNEFTEQDPHDISLDYAASNL